MKTIFSILLVFFLFSNQVFAQDQKNPKDPNSKIIKVAPSSVVIDSILNQNLQGGNKHRPEVDSSRIFIPKCDDGIFRQFLNSINTLPSYDHMPCYKPFYYSNMPVFIPDSSKRYTLLIKKY
jgi:hypothetical protein